MSSEVNSYVAPVWANPSPGGGPSDRGQTDRDGVYRHRWRVHREWSKSWAYTGPGTRGTDPEIPKRIPNLHGR
eukprot:9114579-Pyramimonas_sp.AAC.1